MPESPDFLSPFGIAAESGRPLDDLSDESVRSMAGLSPGPELLALQERMDDSSASFAVLGEVDPNDLGQSGWGIIFGIGVDQAVKEALQPLIDHRRAFADPFVVYDGSNTVQPGEGAIPWLKRNGVSLQVVDPLKGVPFYLLIVAPPEVIPFEFQYLLDIYWAVGRLWFDTADEFRQYAESVVNYEKATSVPTSRNLAMFATEHDFDNATQLFMRNVALPMSQGEGARPVPLGMRQNFGLKTIFSERATKAALADLLGGRSDGEAPSLLFSGSHGMSFLPDDTRQNANQGAIVCQDWQGFGSITEAHWFSAVDVPAFAKVHGMMHVFFACHGGGCSDFDNFDRMNGNPKRIAPKPFFSKLPQKLLAHPNGGALAVLAHIERAWAYSFMEDRASQTQGFRDVIGRLLRGERIGQATDVFNTRWAALSVQLAETQLDLQRGADVSLKALGRMWVARDDARNFMILGDPAVRLRVEDLPPALP
jgi:hypothetical protein